MCADYVAMKNTYRNSLTLYYPTLDHMPGTRFTLSANENSVTSAYLPFLLYKHGTVTFIALRTPLLPQYPYQL